MSETPEMPKAYTEVLDKLTGITARAQAEATGMSPEKQEMTAAFATMLKDLRYIESPANDAGETSIMNTDYFASFVAYHLVRCGWRPHSEKRTIKPRRVPGTGMVADAIEWVGMDELDDPLHNLANMSMADVARLPEVWKYEAIRQLGGTVKSDLPKPKSEWRVDTKINIANAPRDPNEVFK